MALFKVATTRITGRGAHLFDGTGVKMVNGLGIYDMSDRDVGCSYQYVLNLENDREGIARIDTNFVSSAIAGYVNAGFANTFITLSVYPDNNTSLATTSEVILSKNIAIGYAFDSGSILYVKDGVKLRRILVSETIDQILNVTTDDVIYWDDGVDYFRLQVRDGELCLDERITVSPGWDGVEGIDWDNIWGISNP
jgi:hypothetical protein